MASDVDDDWPDISLRRWACAAVVAIPLFALIYSVLYDVSIKQAIEVSILLVPALVAILFVVLKHASGGAA